MAFNLQPSQMVDIREDLSSKVKELSELKSLPLFSQLGMLNQGESCSNVKHEWLDVIHPSKVTLLDTGINNSTTTVIVDRYYNGIECKWAVNHEFVIQDDSDPLSYEKFLVTAVSVSTTTVTLTVATRPFSGTAAAVVADVKIEQLAVLGADGSDISAFDNLVSTRRYNFTQMFRGAVRLASIAQAVDSAARDGSLDEQRTRKLASLMKDLHRNAIRGERRQFNDSNGDEIRTMGGLDYFIPTANVLDQNTTDFSMALVDDIAARIKEKNHEADTLLVHPKMKPSIDALKAARVVSGGMSQSEKNIDNLVTMIDTQAGVLKVITTADVDEKSVYVFNSADFQVVPVQGFPFKTETINKTGSADKLMIEGHYTMVAHLPEAAYKAVDVGFV